MSENLKKKVAVYFDCENVSADFVDFVFNRLDMDNKKPIIKQAFRGWSKANCWNQELLKNTVLNLSKFLQTILAKMELM